MAYKPSISNYCKRSISKLIRMGELSRGHLPNTSNQIINKKAIHPPGAKRPSLCYPQMPVGYVIGSLSRGSILP